MLVVWAGRKEEAEQFRRDNNIGSGGIIVAGNQMARSLDGVRPSCIIQLDGAGEGADGQRVRTVLNASIRKSRNPVPWIDLRGKLA